MSNIFHFGRKGTTNFSNLQDLAAKKIKNARIICVFAVKACSLHMEKPIDFWLRKGKAVGETMPTERSANVPSEGTHPVGEGACRSYYKYKKEPQIVGFAFFLPGYVGSITGQ